MSLIIALANQKGGVGKTTTAINLGAYLASAGHRTLLIDLDAQSNATSGLGVEADYEQSVYAALLDGLPIAGLAQPTAVDLLDIVPATRDLAGAEVELVPLMAREFRLRRSLQADPVPHEFVFVDCPPSLGLLTVNALAAADEVLVPVQCEYLALEGLTQLVGTVELVRQNLNQRLWLSGLVLTMFDGRTNLSQQVEEEVRRHFPQTYDTVIPRSVRLSEAPSHGMPILRYDPGSRGAIAYRALADEFLTRTARVTT